MSVIGSNGGAPELPPVDPGNPLLKPTEASFISAVSTLTDGTPVVIITVRTSSMTATVFLRRDDALLDQAEQGVFAQQAAQFETNAGHQRTFSPAASAVSYTLR